MTDAVTPIRPLPVINDENRPFWEGAEAGELRLQRCGNCGHIRYPVARVCPRCLSDVATWEVMSGRATVFSYVVFHQVYHPAFADLVPYNVALMRLEEGPTMFSNLVGLPEGQVVGRTATVAFERLPEGATIPRFRLDEPA